jgi:energy-converting hydrogenase A subunit M
MAPWGRRNEGREVLFHIHRSLLVSNILAAPRRHSSVLGTLHTNAKQAWKYILDRKDATDLSPPRMDEAMDGGI